MRRYQDLVCSAMVERELDFAGLVAIVNNNLIAYDQSRDLAFTIDSAMRPVDDAAPGRPSDNTATFGPQGNDGATESLILPETAVHLDMEDACRCAPAPTPPPCGTSRPNPQELFLPLRLYARSRVCSQRPQLADAAPALCRVWAWPVSRRAGSWSAGGS